MLRILGALLSVLVIVLGSANPVRPAERTKVTVMYYPSEFTPEMQEAFESANPDIDVELLQMDIARFRAMSATGNPPDIMRCTEEWIPYIVLNRMALDLTPYFKRSKLLRTADFMPIMDTYKYNGKYYGIVKDWSPVCIGYYNKDIFAAAGVPYPSATRPMTLREMAALGRRLQKKEGDRLVIRGLSFWTPPDQIRLTLAMAGERTYTEDGKRVNLTRNKRAREIARFWFELAKEGLIESPLSPSETLDSALFSGGRGAMLVYGYWYGAIAESSVTSGKIGVMAAPVWDRSLPRVSPCAFITGGYISSQTKHPEAAFRVFEWFFGGPPAEEHARVGWGIPALKSKLGLVASRTPFEKERQSNLQNELRYVKYLDRSPYILPNVFNDTIFKYFALALKGDITFDEYLAYAERDINRAIQDGLKQAGR